MLYWIQLSRWYIH